MSLNGCGWKTAVKRDDEGTRGDEEELYRTGSHWLVFLFSINYLIFMFISNWLTEREDHERATATFDDPEWEDITYQEQSETFININSYFKEF